MIRRLAFAVIVAAGLLAAWHLFHLVRDRSLNHDRALAMLAEALADERRVDGRLTGGFRPGVRRSQTRGGERPSSIALLTAAARIESEVTTNPSAPQMVSWGVAQLLLDRVDESVRTLEIAVAIDPASAPALCNLAVAYMTRAGTLTFADDWPLALEVTERALRLQPDQLEALYNRAFLLEQLGLSQPAMKAWHDVLRRDSQSEWAREAQTHLQQLESAAQEPALLTFPDAEHATPANLQTLARAEPQLMREFTDQELLPGWADALASDRQDLEQRRRAQIDAIVEALRARGYGALPDHWQRLKRAPRSAARALADAHTAFARGLADFESDRIAESAAPFETARPLFARIGSPYVLWCDVQLIMAAYIRGEGDAAIARVAQLRSMPALKGYPEIDARLRWLDGLFLAGLRGDVQRGLVNYTAAATLATTLGERENATFLHSLTAEQLDSLGDRRESWRHHLEAIRGRNHARNIRRPHTTLLNAAVSAVRHQWPEVAQYLADADVALTERSQQSLIRVEALLTQARISNSRQATRASHQSVEIAESLVAGLSPVLRRRYEGDLLAVRARFAVPEADQLSLKAADLIESQGGTLRIPELLNHAAEVRLARGDRDGASTVLEDAMRRLTAQVPSVDQVRWSYSNSVWPVFRQAALLHLDRGELGVALEIAERGRFAQASIHGVLERVQAALDPATSVVRFLVGPDRVDAIVIRQSTVQHVPLPITPAALDALVKRYLLEVGGELRASPSVAEVLGRVVTQPLIAIVPEGDTIAFVPDGPLHHLAFGGTTLADGRFLVERNAIEVWTHLDALGPGTGSRADRIVAVGIGTFPSPLPALANAEREASEVASMYSGTALLGSAATPVALGASASGAGLLHFSTHAVANPEFPNLSWIAMAPDETRPQGLLFAHEIRRMDLRGVALVYLSTCDGARGQLSRSEGAASLARAFIDAGAGAVIASGWRIDDGLAHSLSVAFHRQFAAGVPASQALRAAQLEILRSRATRALEWSSVQVYRTPRPVLVQSQRKS
jgi:hypothetical protein